MRLPATAVLVLVLGLAAGGCMGGVRSGQRRAPPQPDPGGAPPPPPASTEPGFEEGPARGLTVGPIVVEDRRVGALTEADVAEFRRIWPLFLRRDRAWPEARAKWLARGGAAPYVLSENLVRAFLAASPRQNPSDLNWVALTARAIGEPAVGYFVNLLILDAWPLKEPVRIKAPDGGFREVTSWVNDDVTRQQAATVLAAIGEPSVPRLSEAKVLRAPVPSARRYAMHALGRIGSDAAVDALVSCLALPEWQDRGAAAKGLGLALTYRKNERARPPLERAKNDPDEFVRRKAVEGLTGKTRLEY